MIIQCHPRLVARLRRFSLVSSIALIVLGCLVLVGWRLDSIWLKSIRPGWANMKPNMALAFIFAGASLWLLRAEQPSLVARRIGRSCAVVVTGIGLLALGEYLFGFHVGIDQLLLRSLANAPAAASLIRISPPGLLNLMLLGGALLLLDVEIGRRFRPAQIFSMLLALIGMVVLLGYIYSAKSLEGMGGYRMAFHTAMGFLVMAAGILAARPDYGLMRIFTSDSAGGTMARRLIPAALLIPAGLGLLRMWAQQRLGFPESLELGVALLMVATMLIFGGMIWFNARWLYSVDVNRQKAEAELRQSADAISDLYNNAPCGYHSLGSDGTILRMNDTELSWLGYQRQEVEGRKKLADFLTPASLKSFQVTFPEFKQLGFLRDAELEMIRKDGSILPVLINATAIKDTRGNFLKSRSTVLDMTDRRRENRRLAIEHSVARILAEAVSLAEATKKIIQSVCDTLEWDAGSLLTLDKPAGLLRCVEFWHGSSVEVQAFEDATRQRTYAPGTGLPGRVWSGGQSVWIKDVVQDTNFPRAAAARQAGLHGAFGFPIRMGGEIIGIIEFFSREIRQPDEDLLRTFGAIGAQIGQFIERKRAEENMARLNQQNHLILGSTAEGILGLDLQGNHTFVNPAAARMLGYEVEELIGRPSHSLWHHTKSDGSPYPMEECPIYAAYQDGAVHRIATEVFWRKNGSSFSVEYESTPIYERGRLAGAVVTFTDITERQCVQTALEHERFLLLALMDNLPDRIYFKDIKGHFLRNNRAHLKRLGLVDPAQVLGKSDFDFFSEEFARQSHENEQQIIRSGESLNKEEERIWPDGHTDWSLITKIPFRDTTGQIVGTFGISRDITERKVAEEQLAGYASELSRNNEQVGEELKMARELQLALLPQQFPVFPARARPEESALQFTSFYHPSGNVSGDYFDVFPISDSVAGIFICDVMGHDVRAALVTAMMRAFVQDLVMLAGDPGRLLTEINHGLAGILKQTGTVMYATAFYLVVDVARGRLLYANAGHPAPLHLHGVSGEVDSLQCDGSLGPALGLFDDAVYKTCQMSVAAGDLLLLFTDGMFEVEGRDHGQYNQEQLLDAVRRHGKLKPADLIAAVLAEVKDFSATKEFADDVCLVGAEVQRLL